MFFAGQQFGRYTLVKQLGKGAYGEVWLAMRHAKFVTTKVAIKLPNTAQVDFEAIRQEAILWEQASGHPNVLPIIEADEFDGQVVIVSEYASEGTLDDQLARLVRFPIRRAVEMAIGIAQGLEFLHSRRIVHRDIKPANVLLQNDTPRLTDFGMSRVVLGSAVSMQVSGTPYYMAPEAFSRKRDRQTDIWSFGVVLYEMITGAMPFPGDEVDDICRAVLNDKPLPLPKSVPRPLRDVILKMLEKSPADRYQTVTEIREELQRILPEMSETTIDAPNTPEAAPTGDGAHRHKRSDFKRSQIVPEGEPARRRSIGGKRMIAPLLIIAVIVGAIGAFFLLSKPDPVPFRRGDKFGFSSWQREPIIAPKYDLARPFVSDRALVGIGSKTEDGEFAGKFGFVDRAGAEVIPIEFDAAASFSENIARIGIRLSSAENQIRYGFIDRTGKRLVEPTFEAAGDFSAGMAAVKFNGKWGYLDKNAGAAIPFMFDEAGEFSEGLAAVRIGDKYGYVDRKGVQLIAPQFDQAGRFVSGLAPVKRDGRVFFIRPDGSEAIGGNFNAAGQFSEGLALVESNGKAGFIDTTGTLVIPHNYESTISLFSEGAAAVPLNGRFGYINKHGALLIPFRYRSAGPFRNKLALVTSAADGTEFYISFDGTEFYEP